MIDKSWRNRGQGRGPACPWSFSWEALRSPWRQKSYLKMRPCLLSRGIRMSAYLSSQHQEGPREGCGIRDPLPGESHLCSPASLSTMSASQLCSLHLSPWLCQALCQMLEAAINNLDRPDLLEIPVKQERQAWSKCSHKYRVTNVQNVRNEKQKVLLGTPNHGLWWHWNLPDNKEVASHKGTKRIGVKALQLQNQEFCL